MRLGRTAWLVLGIGIFLIAFVILYVLYSQQVSEQEELEARQAVAQATWSNLVSEKGDWEDRVANLQSELTQLERGLTQLERELILATSSLNRTKSSFPGSVESIEYDDLLFQFADDWQLAITGVTSSEPQDQEVEGITYSTTLFTVVVEGEKPILPFATNGYALYIDRTVANILGFINTIVTSEDLVIAPEMGDITFSVTLSVEGVTMNVPEPLTDEEIEAMVDEGQEFEKPSATINFVIYCYQGE